MRARAGAVLAAFHEGAGAGIHEGVHEGGGIREDLHIYIYIVYIWYIYEVGFPEICHFCSVLAEMAEIAKWQKISAPWLGN